MYLTKDIKRLHQQDNQQNVVVNEETITITSKDNQQQHLVIDISDDEAKTYDITIETYLKNSKQEWLMFLEICLKYQLKQNKPGSGLNNLKKNLLRLMTKEDVIKEEMTLMLLIKSSLYYMRYILIHYETFIGYPIEMFDNVISHIGLVMIDMKENYMND